MLKTRMICNQLQVIRVFAYALLWWKRQKESRTAFYGQIPKIAILPVIEADTPCLIVQSDNQKSAPRLINAERLF